MVSIIEPRITDCHYHLLHLRMRIQRQGPVPIFCVSEINSERGEVKLGCWVASITDNRHYYDLPKPTNLACIDVKKRLRGLQGVSNIITIAKLEGFIFTC